METQPLTRPPQQIAPARLWFGAAGGAVAWALHGFTSFLISTQACSDGTGDWGPLSGPAVRVLFGGVTAVFLAIAVSGGVVSFHNWRQLSRQSSLPHAEGLGRESFMALVGVFVGVVFVLGILWAGIPPLLVNVCVNAR